MAKFCQDSAKALISTWTYQFSAAQTLHAAAAGILLFASFLEANIRTSSLSTSGRLEVLATYTGSFRSHLHLPSVRNNGMVARELPLGPARWSCIYMVFAPYLTLSSVRNLHCTNITAIPLQFHLFIRLFRCRLSS